MIEKFNKQRDASVHLSICAGTNLYLMLTLAARADHTAVVELLFAFHASSGIPQAL